MIGGHRLDIDDTLPKHHRATRREKLVIAASSLGTVFEWYDFYLYGLLATIISAQFFSGVNDATAFILALAAFAAGFAVRRSALWCLGGSAIWSAGNIRSSSHGHHGRTTFAVGLLPTYASAGIAAPLLLVGLRLLQGLALGGQYGGAATYVAEHAPDHKRGLYTSWIQTTATLGLFAALLVVIGVRTALGEEAFSSWGWRLPFLASVILLGVSLWIRLQLNESPVYQKMKAEGGTSKSPLKESFGNWGNLRLVLIALLALSPGKRSSGTPDSSMRCSTSRKSSRWMAQRPISSSQWRWALARPSSFSSAGFRTRSAASPIILAGLRDCRARLFPAVPCADGCRKSGAGPRAGDSAGHGLC